MTGFFRRLTLAFVCLASVTGCATQGFAPGVPATFPAQDSSIAKSPLLYVANTFTRHGVWYGSLLGFAGDASGNVPPVVTIGGKDTGLGYFTTGAAVDKSGRLYILGHDYNYVGVWPAGSHGNVKPTAYFLLDYCSSFDEVPISFKLDDTGNLWVACKAYDGDAAQPGQGEGGQILEYAPLPADATGYIKTTPIRQIVGDATGLQRLTSIAINANGQVSVEDQRGTGQRTLISTFAAGANGNVAPLSRLGGDKTQLGNDKAVIDEYDGISYDSQGRLVACTNRKHEPRLITFTRRARGNVAPVSILSVAGCSRVALDPQDNLYVSFANSITEYAAGSAGSAKPLRTISGKLTSLSTAHNMTF